MEIVKTDAAEWSYPGTATKCSRENPTARSCSNPRLGEHEST